MSHLDMEGLGEEAIRTLVGNFYQANAGRGKKYTVDYFKKHHLGKTMIYNTIQRVEKKISLKRKPGGGRKSFELSPDSKRTLIEATDGKVGYSYRKLAELHGTCAQTMRRTMTRYGIHRKRRINAPKVTEKQFVEQKKRLNRARKGTLQAKNGLEVIMDDESNYPYKWDKLNDYYYTTGRKEVKPEIKYKTREKYGKKLMVWMAISAKGHSEPYFMPRGTTINQYVYQKECIEKLMVPFIEKHHSDGQFIFWPDLASSHYAKTTRAKYDSLGIPYVPRNENPPNAPQIRPIEDFWAYHKSLVYQGGWEAKSDDDLKTRFNWALNLLKDGYFERLMGRVKTKVRKAAENGLNSQLH
jgi:hypothetical protein